MRDRFADATNGRQPFRISNFVVKPSLNEISRPGEGPLRLEGRVMDVLVYLASNSREVVSKEDLLDAVWRDVNVSEDALFRCIRELRRALDDNPKAPRFIETIPKRGYRLLPEVVPVGDKQSARPISAGNQWKASTSKGKDRHIIWVPVVLILLLAIWWVVPWPAGPGSAARPALESIAVLPFVPIGDEEELGYLSFGIADGIAFSLSQVEGIRVISNMSSLHYRREQAIDPRAVAQDLGVRVLLLGRLMKSSEGLMITAELVDGSSNELLWGRTFSGRQTEVLSIQQGIAGAVVEHMAAGASGTTATTPDRYRVSNPEAYNLYLQGRYHWGRTTEEGFLKAIDYFSSAIEAQPDYALAYSGLADAHSLMGLFGFTPPAAAFPKAKEAAVRALELNPSLAEAHTSLAGVLQIYEWNWKDAQQHYRTALALNPNYVTAHHWYALFSLAPRGLFEEAVQELRKALELTPLSLRVNTALGFIHYLSGRFEESIQQYKKTVELEPTYASAYHFLSLSYLEMGRVKDAIELAEKAVLVSQGASYSRLGLAYVQAASGSPEIARSMLDELGSEEAGPVSPYQSALVYASLGERDTALHLLNRAKDEHFNGLVHAGVDPRLSSIRDDPRLQRLLSEIGLPSSED